MEIVRWRWRGRRAKVGMVEMTETVCEVCAIGKERRSLTIRL